MQDNTQLKHSDYQQSDKKFPLSLIANDISSPLNVGSLFRLSDALGISKLYLCGKSAVPPNSKINKTSRSTEKYVSYEYHEDANILVDSLKSADTLIVSLEITSSSLTLGSSEFVAALATRKKVCLILGAENTGVNETLLALSELTVHIPMNGANSSMNVVSAASIACYEITKNM